MNPYLSSSATRRFRSLSAVLALLGLAAAPLGAAAWRSIGPGGGDILERPIVAPSEPQTAYVVGQNETGIFRTENGGETWSRLEIHSALRPYDLVAIDPRNARSLFGEGITPNAVARLIASGDGGAHWHLASAGLPLDQHGHVDLYGGVVFDPAVPGHLLAGTFSSGLYESRDGGGHWAPAGLAGEVVIALGAAAPNELWAALLGGDDDRPVYEIRESRDGGATWTSTGWPERRGFNFLSFIFDSRAPERPYVIVDDRLFHRAATGWDLLRPAGHTLDLVALAEGTLVAATDRGVRRSRDGGRTWKGGGRPRLASLAQVGPREILAIGEYGAWRSKDGGEHFAASSRGLDAQHIAILAAAADGTVWAGSQGPGLMRTKNGGGDWTRQIRGLGIDPKAYPPFLAAFAASPRQPEELYASLTSGQLALARSRDGGTHWSYATFPVAARDDVNVRLAVDPRDAERILLASTKGGEGPLISHVWRSDDGGRSWSAPFTFREREYVIDFALDPVDPETAFALATDGLWTSHDGGKSFRRASRGLPRNLSSGFTLAIDPERHANVYVAAFAGIYQSRDGGATFHRLGPVLAGAQERGIAIASGGRVLVASIGQGVQLWHPETGRFESAGPGLPLEVFSAQILVDPKERRTVYASTYGRSVWRLDLDE